MYNKSRLITFYNKHNPEKTAADVDTILDKFKGREDVLFASLPGNTQGRRLMDINGNLIFICNWDFSADRQHRSASYCDWIVACVVINGNGK